MTFFKNYFNQISKDMNNVNIELLDKAVDLILDVNKKGGKVIIGGNGASASISSHISVDLTKNAKVRAINFNEANLITCFANDYGYEKWLEKAIEFYAHEDDLAILISSSGRSRNIISAALKAKKLGLSVITLSGFDANNPLRQIGDINLWVDSKIYNIVETIHNAWLAAIVDKIEKYYTK